MAEFSPVSINSDVLFSQQDHIAFITLNRPNSRNAINAQMAQSIDEIFEKIEKDRDIWSIVLSANGPVFCAGADLKELSQGKANDLCTPNGGFAGITSRKRSKPLIAAVEGPAFAGGAEILLACDLIVASTQVSISIPEVKRSLIPAAGGLSRLSKHIPFHIALELALTGDALDAERALHFGMFNYLTSPGEAMQRAIELAQQINENAPLAVQKALTLIYKADEMSDSQAIAEAGKALEELGTTQDFHEGLQAFIEKRKPKWEAK